MIAEATTVPEYALVISEKGGQERRQLFHVPELTVGRVQGNDLVLPKGNVSKRHARILYREGRFIVTDLNSTNGTYVNRRRITQATIIRDGDKVYVGDFIIRVEPKDGQLSSLGPESPFPGQDTPSMVPAELADSEAELTGAHAVPSVMPGWERPSDEISRPSSGPPPRFSEAPVSQESSHGSQRVSDMAGGHRQAVARVIEVVTARLGETAVVPSELETERIQSAISRAIDEIFAEEEVPQGTSTEAVAEQAESELLGLGPLTELLQDPAVSSISAARFDDIVGTRDGRQQSFPPGFSSPAALDLAVRRMCPRPSDKEEADSVIEVTLEGGARLSALRGRVAPHGPLFSIHKPRKINSSLDDLVRRGAISRTMATFLGHCVAARLNILVVGPRDEGARTVLSALCSATNRERIITASDFDEIATDSDAAVRLDMSAYDGDARRLLEAAASVSQARLAVTLTSSTLIAATLEAMGSGMSGILASLRASNLSRALLRLPADVAAERPGVSLEAAAGWVLSGFDLAIEVARLRDGRVRVLRIVELLPGEGSSAIVLGDIFRFTVSRVAAGGAVEGHFSPSGEVPQIAAQLQAMGMRVEPSLFSRPPSR